jgi:hypothetical protein
VAQAEPIEFAAAIAIAQFWLAPVLALLVSGAFFAASPRTQPFPTRFAASAHGLSIAALYLGALAVNVFGGSRQSLGMPFLLLLLVPVALVAVSFFIYRGRRSLLYLHAINAVCIAWTFFIGTMAVTGEWL